MASPKKKLSCKLLGPMMDFNGCVPLPCVRKCSFRHRATSSANHRARKAAERMGHSPETAKALGRSAAGSCQANWPGNFVWGLIFSHWAPFQGKVGLLLFCKSCSGLVDRCGGFFESYLRVIWNLLKLICPIVDPKQVRQQEAFPFGSCFCESYLETICESFLEAMHESYKHLVLVQWELFEAICWSAKAGQQDMTEDDMHLLTWRVWGKS